MGIDWQAFSDTANGVAVALALLTPVILTAALLLRGFRTWPLVRALLWRFRWANGLFVLLIAVSVGMGAGLIAQERGLRMGTAQAAEKFELVIAAPGSDLTAMLAAVFLQPSNIPLLDGDIYNAVANHARVQIAAPVAFGDSYGASPVVGTTAEFVTYLTDNRIDGRLFETSLEAVAGALVPLSPGDVFTPAHGLGRSADAGAHGGFEITVVGQMPRTGSPWDNAILVPVESVWEVHGLANGHALEDANRIGPPFEARFFPGTPAIIVRADSLASAYALRSEFSRDSETMAFFPATLLSDLYRVMGDVRQVMSVMSIVTQILVAVSVLLGLFILSRLFSRHLALLRAVGAPARFVMAVVWLYGLSLLAAGTALGLGVGLAAANLLSRLVTARTDILVEATLSWGEVHLAFGFLAVTCLLSLLPAILVPRQNIVAALRA